MTADSGGCALPIEASGTYTITFSGSGLAGDVARTVAVGGSSFLLDLVVGQSTGGEPEAITGAASAVSQTGASLNGIVNANGQDVDYYFEYGTTGQYGEISDVFSTSANTSIRVDVSGLTEGTLYHYRLVAVTDAVTVYGNDRSLVTTTRVDNASQHASGGGGGGSGGCFIQIINR